MILRITNQPELETSPPFGIAAIAEARFRSDSHTALWGIACKAERGVIVLVGRLGSFYQKQLAQEIVGHIEGVVQVVNQIEVVSGDQSHKVTGPATEPSVNSIVDLN